MEETATDTPPLTVVPAETEPVADQPETFIYPTRIIPDFRGRPVRIICQSKNGPCSLIAICNCLLLNGEPDFQLPDSGDVNLTFTSLQLLSALGNFLLAKSPSSATHLDSLHELQKGVLINPHLSHPQSFEIEDQWAKEILGAVQLPIYHAWTIDLARDGVNSGLSDCSDVSYQGLVDEMLRLEALPPSQVDEHTRALRIKLFLEQNATQCTAHGLQVLGDLLPWDKCVIFFRNNHFLTLMKLRIDPDVDALYKLITLVTDSSFVHGNSFNQSCYWETVTVDGDSQFLDCYFRPAGSGPLPALPPRPIQEQPHQLAQDQESQKSPGVFDEFVKDFKDVFGLNSGPSSTATSSAVQSSEPTPQTFRKRKSKDCIIQ